MSSDSPVIDWTVFRGLDSSSPLVTIEATVVTGFEMAALNEVQEMFGLSEEAVSKYQGRILFDLDPKKVNRTLSLKTVDNLHVLIGALSKFDLKADKDECLSRLINTLSDLHWEKGLDCWRKISGFTGRLVPSKVDLETEVKTDLKKGAQGQEEEDKLIPKFRCTCYRSGTSHSFGSMDAAREIGGAIQDKFQWIVQMKDFDIETVVNIDNDQVYYTLKLTKESLFRRNIEHFGPTTLRATIAACLLRLAKIQPGEIVVDSLCGGGSIPVEGATSYKGAYFLGGDYHEKAAATARKNVQSLEERLGRSLSLDVVRWDVTKLTLRNNTVDVFVTDLPFGKRSGSKADNRILYPQVLNSMARVVRPTTGRAIILTQDKTSMFKSMGKFNKYWKTNKYFYCNIGGLAALTFVMTRTDQIPSA